MAAKVVSEGYLGDFSEDDTLHFIWSTVDSGGASITRSTDGTVSVYKDNGVTQSAAGITDTEDFDSLTGIHACTIDLSSDAFYATGSNYTVVLSAATIDTQTVNAVLAHFSIENRAMTDGVALGTLPKVDVKEIDTDAIAAQQLELAYQGIDSDIVLPTGHTSSTVIFDASGISSVDDFYNGMTVLLNIGTGGGQARLIVDYVGSTKTATVYPDWATTPDGTSGAIILPGGAFSIDSSGRVDVGSWLGTAVTTSSTTSKPEVDVNSISDDATAADNLELFTEGTALSTLPKVNVEEIDATNAAAQKLRYANHSHDLDLGIDSATANTIVFNSSEMVAVDDYYNGMIVYCVGSTGTGQARLIVDYVGSTKTATVFPDWGTTPVASSDAVIIPGPGNFYDSSGRVDVGQWLGTAVTTSSTTSKPEVDTNSISDDATAADNLELFTEGTELTNPPIVEIGGTMDTLYIQEYEKAIYIPQSDRAQIGPGLLQAPKEPALTNQAINFTTGSATQSVAFNINTRFVRVHAGNACWIKFGTDPTATSADMRLAANSDQLFSIATDTSTYKLSLIK